MSKAIYKNKLNVIYSLKTSNYNIELTKDGSSYRSRDWGFKCLDCGIERCQLNAYEVLHSGKRFCGCSGKITCNSAEEAKEDLINKLAGSIWNLISFPEEFTTKRDCWVEVQCKVCNKLHTTRFGNSYRKGCPHCAHKATTVRLSKDTDWFIEKCSEIHNFKYDYSKVDYKKARQKVEIICHEHEEPFHFWQSPDNHKNKAKGCPECKRLRLKYVSFHQSRVEDNKSVFKNISNGVYLSRLSNGVYKIGITCDLSRRNPEIRRDSKLDIETIHYREMNMYNALHLENKLHRLYDYCNYTFDYEWAGHKECFALEEKDIKDIINYIETYEVSSE